MREIILDTETTGLSPLEGHRIVEIGAIELLNHLPTGNTLQIYLNPERDMPKEAEAVHGLSNAFLKDKSTFKSQASTFLEFIGDSNLIIHNASFDMAFINAELSSIGRETIAADRVLDTLQMARKRHPMGPNSLDALCKRYDIDNTKRTKHGALMDAELLAEVYLELIGGRQTNFGLDAHKKTQIQKVKIQTKPVQGRKSKLKSRLSPEEEAAHSQMVAKLGKGALWNNSN